MKKEKSVRDGCEERKGGDRVTGSEVWGRFSGAGGAGKLLDRAGPWERGLVVVILGKASMSVLNVWSDTSRATYASLREACLSRTMKAEIPGRVRVRCVDPFLSRVRIRPSSITVGPTGPGGLCPRTAQGIVSV
jgi:hypothetical protein